MKLFHYLYVFMISSGMLVFDFDLTSDISNWRVVNDGVMGGLSEGTFVLSDEGHGVFKGSVSLENNGGFSSVRYQFATKEVAAYQKFVVRLKGDGKRYQFRVKTSKQDFYSYIHIMETSGDWEVIEIPFDHMYPAFRGRTLEMPNYPGKQMEAVALLIGNKKRENFRLEIDYIKVE